MTRTLIVKNITVALAACTLFGTVQLAGADAASTTVLDLQLNEPTGSRSAADSSGLGRTAPVGSHAVMTGAYADFDRHAPGAGVDVHSGEVPLPITTVYHVDGQLTAHEVCLQLAAQGWAARWTSGRPWRRLGVPHVLVTHQQAETEQINHAVLRVDPTATPCLCR